MQFPPATENTPYTPAPSTLGHPSTSGSFTTTNASPGSNVSSPSSPLLSQIPSDSRQYSSQSVQSNLILPTYSKQTRSKCGIQKPNPLYSLISSSISPIPYDPKSTLLDKNWDCAMTKEFDALIKQTTWDLVPCPLDTNVIGCHWIFCHKIQMGH